LVTPQFFSNRGQLVLERDVEKLDDLCVALHGSLPLKKFCVRARCLAAESGRYTRERLAMSLRKWLSIAVEARRAQQARAACSDAMIDSAKVTHWPHFGRRSA
jgi:hypothetical protein